MLPEALPELLIDRAAVTVEAVRAKRGRRESQPGIAAESVAAGFFAEGFRRELFHIDGPGGADIGAGAAADTGFRVHQKCGAHLFLDAAPEELESISSNDLAAHPDAKAAEDALRRPIVREREPGFVDPEIPGQLFQGIGTLF